MLEVVSTAAAVRAPLLGSGHLHTTSMYNALHGNAGPQCATASAIASRSVTSAPRPSARADPTAAAAATAASWWRSTSATDAPRACRARVGSNPIPRAAPVTSATLPGSAHSAIRARPVLRLEFARREEGFEALGDELRPLVDDKMAAALDELDFEVWRDPA